MKKNILFLILFFIIIVILSGCQYFRLMPHKEWTETSEEEDEVIIYIAGAYDDSGIVKPCYWKIKDEDKIERVDLESIPGVSNNIAYSIDVIGDNVYTSGNYFNGTNQKACYWINKKKYNLQVEDPNLSSSIAYSIKVRAGIIFTAGTDGPPIRGCGWINQNKMQYDKLLLSARSIFIHNLSSSKYTIYIGGQNMLDHACYIKNDTIIDLPYGSAATSEVYSIYIIGNTVYTAGTLDLTDACLWKNSDLILLPNGRYAYSVFVSNDDIYIAGQSSTGEPCYWKNSEFIQLPPIPSTGGSAYSIYVFNDNVYISGYEDVYACYWINKKQIFLEDTISMGFSIFVTKNNDK